MMSDDNVKRVSPVNVLNKFRDAFEDYTPGDHWTQVFASGDIIAIDGNAAAASYLVISKDPLTAGTESSITSTETFDMPADVAIGVSMSQRTLGQEFAFEFVDTSNTLPAPVDLAISSIQQATTTLTISTTLPHNLRPGMRFGVRGCSDSRLNYPALVVASTPTATQLTATAGPGGAIPSVTAGPFANGFVFGRSALGLAANGTSMIFENGTVTNASFYVRSEAGDALPSGTILGNHAITVGTSASVQAISAAGAYSFQPTNEFRLLQMIDNVQWSDVGVDSVSPATSRYKRTQVVPNPSARYRVRVRATNAASMTRPVAQIVSAVKSGSTTATITTDVPHGLTTADQIVVYGIRAQGASEFPNLLTATAVASTPTATTFTVVIGTSGTITSYGGYVARVDGGNLMSALGANAVVAQSIARTSNVVTVTGNTTWAGLVIGDYVNLVGCRDNSTGASLGIDGAYRVRNFATTSLELEPVGTTPTGGNIGSTNCGGAIIRRTCARLSFVRVLDFERQRVEQLPRPINDSAAATPVHVMNTATNLISGSVAQDSAVPNPVGVGGRASNANLAAMSATGDLVNLMMTMIGAAVIKPYAIPESEWAFTGALTSTSDVQVQAAAGAGIKRHVTLLQATNTGASAVDVLLRDATTTRVQITVPAGQSVVVPLPTGIPTTANAVLNVALSAAGTVRVNVLGYTAP